MKKFYYSREASQDEPSHSFHLDHRNTMHVNNEQGRGMSGRAASVNSLDLLSEAPTIPRVTTRDVTRSMSDVSSKAKPKRQNLITETELSSSWLYKTMQASINSRFKSPRKSPSIHKGDLEQSILQDPELKPISVKSKAAKTSSCICNFATMMAISLCTIGFLVSVAAIIYMEIFADRNVTFLHNSEAEVDISDVKFDSREVYNLTTQKLDGEHILNEALTHRFDGDEETLNDILKVSSTNDIPNLLNKSINDGRFADYVTDNGNLEKTELRQYINDTNSKIKFQDGVTVIYEMKSNESSIGDVEENLSMEFKGRSFGMGFNQNEDTFKDGLKKSTKNNLNDNLEQEFGIYEKSDEIMLNDSVPLTITEGLDKQSDFMLKGSELEENSQGIASEDLKFNGLLVDIKADALEKNESLKQTFEDKSSEKINSSEINEVKDVEKDPNIDTNVLREDKTNNTNEFETFSSNITEVVKDSNSALANFSELQTVQYEDEVSQSTLKSKDQSVTDEYDVNTMLVTVDDAEASSTDPFLSKRNGEINLFQVSSPVPSVEPIKQINGDSSVLPKKSGDIKGSLADAMKHLQKLDVNNKLLTSRTKPKQKVNSQKPKRKSVSNKDEERKRYLQRMRLMLFKHLQ